MKYLLILLLALSMPLMAQDSGLYYNVERDGEGINLIRNGDTVVFYLYTYENETGCWNIEIPETGLVNESNCGEQRWFLSGGDKIIDDSVIEGWLYMGIGTGYPKCIPDANDPFLSICGEAHIVGRYIMSRYNDGWRMIVLHFGEILGKEDHLYSTVFEFTTQLLVATD